MGSEHMDYKEHNRTYSGFISMVKWGIPLSILLFGFVLMFTHGK